MTNQQLIPPSDTLRMMSFQKAIEILGQFRRDPETYNLPDLLDAIAVALFLMQLCAKGDFTYEPLP